MAGTTNRLWFLILGILLLSPSLSGQDEYVRFKRITINEGLSLSSVYYIYQDSKGFMWFGTEDGLNKYDGQTITVYGATTDQYNILANKWVELVYEDKSGVIWVGSRGGLTKYNPRQGVFSPLRHDPEDISSLSNDTISAIEADLSNELWVGTFQGLNRVDRFTNSVERIEPEDPALQGLTSRITAFLQDESGAFWIATCEGLFSYDTKSGLFFQETAGGLIDESTSVYTMTYGEDCIWLGTDSALICLDLTPAQEHRSFPLVFELPDSRMINLLVDYWMPCALILLSIVTTI